MDAEKMMMQKRIDNLCEQLEIVKRERDALKHDLKECHCCTFCQYNQEINEHCENADSLCCECIYDCNCKNCEDGSAFEWRGVQENGGIEA